MIEHRSLPIVRLQETRLIQIFCSRFSKRASIRSPPGNHLCPTFFSDRGIYDAAIILGRIQDVTEPIWSIFFCTRLTIEHGRQFACVLSTVEHQPTPAQISKRDHALDHGGAHPRALKRFFFSFFSFLFFALFLHLFLVKLK